MINLNAQYVNGLTNFIFAIHSGKLEKICKISIYSGVQTSRLVYLLCMLIAPHHCYSACQLNPEFTFVMLSSTTTNCPFLQAICKEVFHYVHLKDI